MKRHGAYLHYMAWHKWQVFCECCKLGIPWLGIIHDWSKFLPDEWLPLVRARYGPDGTERPCRKPGGEWDTDSLEPEVSRALVLHLIRNKHHWQYWVFLDAGPVYKPLPMPDRYRREMLADWRASGLQPGRLSLAQWYEQNRARIILHRETRQWLDREIRL